MQSLDLAVLETVTGGAAPPSDFGRCGPGSSWPILGNVFTPECRAHDAAVRDAKAGGDPAWLAHVKALPLLPAAAASYVRARVTGQ
jgi:hypothetical protein